MVGSRCSPRDSQESSPTPQFKSINSSALSFLYSPTLTSILDYWINHQFSSVAQSCPTLCDPMNRNTPGLPVHHHLPEFTQTHIHQVSDAVQPSILGCPLLLLPPIPPSIRVFSNESTLRVRWPKYWSFSSLASFLPKKSQG